MANQRVRDLRQNSTDAERRLWSLLRDRRLQGYKFRRQRPIGPFIVDFACLQYRLVVEADGGQHSESSTDEQRKAWLEDRGWRVIRFWNNDILANTEGVFDAIVRALCEPSPTQRFRAGSPLSRKRERV